MSSTAIAVSTVAGSSTTDGATSTSRSSAATATHPAPPRHHAGANRTRRTRTTDGPPPAPAGLSETDGYGTYELCRGTCSGSVPASLRRPLKLPPDDGGPCPVTLSAHGPVTPLQLGSGLGVSSFGGSAWLAARVTWAVSGAYTGPLLIRGGQLGDGGAVGFGEGRTPYDELQLLAAGRQAPAVASGGRAWLSFTRVRGPGCYAYQVDGIGFSEEIVFRAVG
jgi:hypothetical protein